MNPEFARLSVKQLSRRSFQLSVDLFDGLQLLAACIGYQFGSPAMKVKSLSHINSIMYKKAKEATKPRGVR